MSHPSRSRIRTVAVGVGIAVVCLCLVGASTVTAQQINVDANNLAGNGTADDPYQITNASELQAMEDDLDAHYELTTDIDASDTAQWNGGSGFDPVGDGDGDFNGHLDGNGFQITQLTIDRSNSNEEVGLFGEVDSATIESVYLDSVTIAGNRSVGALAGYLEQDTTVRRASANGSVSGGTNTGGLIGSIEDSSVEVTSTRGSVTGESDVGGLAGQNVGGVITQSFSQATVNATGKEQNGLIVARAGGLTAGNFNTGIINQSYATGDVSGGKVGGLAGENYNGSQVVNTYAAGRVDGRFNDPTGGVIGDDLRTCPFQSGCESYQATSVSDSYWDVETASQSSSSGSATGLTTAQMTGEAAQANMDGLDFETTWTTTESYPTLRGLSNRPTQEAQSVASVSAPPDDSYSPSSAFTIGTAHNATGTIDSNDVAIRLINATADNGTVIALNDAVPIAGQVNTTIPAGSLSGDITIAVQLYNLSSQQVVASDTVNLTAEPEPSVTFDDQTIPNGSSTVSVDSATLSNGGFVAIRSTPVVPDNGTAADSVVGVSEYLESGTSENIRVTLNEPVTKNQTLVATPHFDTNGDETYDFVTSDREADGPYTVNGSPVSDTASITVGPASIDPTERALQRFDDDGDGDGTIDRDEAVGAIVAYNTGSTIGGEEVTRTQVVQAIVAYNTGEPIEA